jgi:hypothetical protein
MDGNIIFAIVVVGFVAGVFGLLLLTGGLRLRSGRVIGRKRRD